MSTKTRQGRKAELRRLAAKHGWRDGHSGVEGRAPTKAVMAPGGRVAYNPAPADEETAYWRGYDEGKDAKRRGVPGNANPYGMAT